MDPEFSALLTQIRNNAWRIGQPFGQMVDDAITSATPPGFGLVATQDVVQVGIADKLATLVNTVAKTYLDSVGQYYTVKGQIAQLKAASKGGIAVEASKNISAASSAFQANPLPWIVGGGLLLVLLMRK